MLSTHISQLSYEMFALHKAGILFVNVTTKKIQVALELASVHVKNFDYLIWIAPANFLETLLYTNEIKKNCQNFRNRLKFYAIESISVSDVKYLELFNLVQNYKVFCIIDDGLTIKNMESCRTQRLLFLSRYFVYRLILCSIPVTQGLIDLFSQLEFLNTKILR